MAKAYLNYGLRGQARPIPGREKEMLPNNAGGYGFQLDDWERLERFLILGSESGTYYVNESTLTEQNATCAIRCIQQDGVRAVNMAHDVNFSNRAPKADQQLFVMALALKYGDQATKNVVRGLIPNMLRTGIHLLHFTAMLDGLGGWNRTKRSIISRWFNEKSGQRLAYQVLKYQNRDGWAMRDALRLSHAKPPDRTHNQIYRFAIGQPDYDSNDLPGMMGCYGQMRGYMNEGGNPAKAAMLGIEWGLPREALPTESLNDLAVWEALLPQTPPHALLRNLGRLTANGLLNMGGNLEVVLGKLSDRGALERARVHPFAVLLAKLIYDSGVGLRGHLHWTPIQAISQALDTAYELCLGNVASTNKRLLVACDISGSMSAPCVGTPIPASLAAGAMAYTIMQTEPHAQCVLFDTATQPLPFDRETATLSSFLGRHMIGGGTDVAAPIRYALGQPGRQYQYYSAWDRYHSRAGQMQVQGDGIVKVFDAFLILTDNETWAGIMHPADALQQYRNTVNKEAKLICAAMAANHANIVDPQDMLSLGCAGLDTNLPTIINGFLGGSPLRIGFSEDDAED